MSSLDISNLFNILQTFYYYIQFFGFLFYWQQGLGNTYAVRTEESSETDDHIELCWISCNNVNKGIV